MQVNVESPQPGIMMVRLLGDLDMNEATGFRHTLADAVMEATRGVILELAEVGFMDSSGIAVLIEGLKWCRARALPYILTHLTPGVKMVIELARLEDFFTIAGDVEEAMALIPGLS